MDFYVLAAQVLPGLLIAIMLELRALLRVWGDEARLVFELYVEVEQHPELMNVGGDLEGLGTEYMSHYFDSGRKFSFARWSALPLPRFSCLARWEP
jgi:hypothetical protein